MSKICDHSSVGMIVWQNEKILLIERMKIPYGFACPAGHVDSDLDSNGLPDYEAAAKRELSEEVGLNEVSKKLLLELDKPNHCRREDGSWHHWRVYQVETKGELKRSEDETKQADFYSLSDVKLLAEKTKSYLNGEISDDVWQRNPGLEPVWLEFFQELKII